MRLIQSLSMNVLGQWGGGLLTVPGVGVGGYLCLHVNSELCYLPALFTAPTPPQSKASLQLPTFLGDTRQRALPFLGWGPPAYGVLWKGSCSWDSESGCERP